MFRSPMFQLIELLIPATAAAGQQINFLAQTQLQSVINDATVYIKAIETFSSVDMPVSPLSGNPVAAPADIANAFISLQVSGVLQYNYLPLTRLHSIFSGGGSGYNSTYQLFLLKNVFKVDWTKCFVGLCAAPVTQPPYVHLFGVHYSYCAEPGDPSTVNNQR